MYKIKLTSEEFTRLTKPVFSKKRINELKRSTVNLARLTDNELDNIVNHQNGVINDLSKEINEYKFSPQKNKKKSFWVSLIQLIFRSFTYSIIVYSIIISFLILTSFTLPTLPILGIIFAALFFSLYSFFLLRSFSLMKNNESKQLNNDLLTREREILNLLKIEKSNRNKKPIDAYEKNQTVKNFIPSIVITHDNNINSINPVNSELETASSASNDSQISNLQLDFSFKITMNNRM